MLLLMYYPFYFFLSSNFKGYGRPTLFIVKAWFDTFLTAGCSIALIMVYLVS
jgi:hypothetical protein